MVRVLLGVRGALSADAADALAVAVCHAHARRLGALVAQQGASRVRQAQR
jgi:crossover junction endodeoxyribonuclease RuvC